MTISLDTAPRVAHSVSMQTTSSSLLRCVLFCALPYPGSWWHFEHVTPLAGHHPPRTNTYAAALARGMIHSVGETPFGRHYEATSAGCEALRTAGLMLHAGASPR